MNLSILSANVCKVIRNSSLRIAAASYCNKTYDGPIIDPPETLELCDNNYRQRFNESLQEKKARLLYQSRKRGMLENDLILSTFADKYLQEMDQKQIDEYDKLINLPSNDWDLYNWAIGKKMIPAQFKCSVMDMLQEHTKNTNKEQRFKQPALN